jgi:hypothetical protein
MKVNRLSPDLYEIEDFVTLDQQTAILDYAKSLDEPEWWQKELDGTFFSGKQKYGELPAIFDPINENIQNLFSNLRYVGGVALQRHNSGESMGVHKDYWLKEEDYHIRFGLCIYYNDDYLGGEIDYPDLGIVHKPKARSLVMHGGNIAHGTMLVKSENYRYFSTCFVSGSADEPVILNPCIFGSVEQSDGSNYP